MELTHEQEVAASYSAALDSVALLEAAVKAKESALAKLAKLGLTEDEVKAIIS